MATMVDRGRLYNNQRVTEAGLEETKTILGWFFDFRTLTVKLPMNKFTAWSNAIK